MRLLTPLAGLLIALTFLKAPASADEKDRAVKLAEFRKAAHDDENTSKAIASWREIFSRAIQMHADEVASDYDLDADHRRILNVAAKGVSERYLRRWIDTVAIRLIVLEEKEQESDFADSLFNTDDVRQIGWLAGTWPIVRAMQRDAVWQQALQKLLTKEQLQKVEAKGRVRDERILDTLTTWALERLDQDCLLATQQRDRLRPMIRKQFAEAPKPISEHIYGQIFTMAWVYRMPANQLADVLTRTQLNLWNERVEMYAEFADDLGSDSFLVNDWFDPDTLKRDGIEIPQTE